MSPKGDSPLVIFLVELLSTLRATPQGLTASDAHQKYRDGSLGGVAIDMKRMQRSIRRGIPTDDPWVGLRYPVNPAFPSS